MVGRQVHEEYMAHVAGRTFAMVADVTRMSGWRLAERVGHEWKLVNTADVAYARAYEAARKRMP